MNTIGKRFVLVPKTLLTFIPERQKESESIRMTVRSSSSVVRTVAATRDASAIGKRFGARRPRGANKTKKTFYNTHNCRYPGGGQTAGTVKDCLLLIFKKKSRLYSNNSTSNSLCTFIIVNC